MPYVQRDKTVVIIISDNGEKPGERSIWFKKHYYEPSLKISLINLLPTLMSIAQGSGWTCPVEPLKGIDLSTVLNNEQTGRPIYTEYVGHATASPIFMMRNARKLVMP
jgi:choline-sulfatase